MRWGVGWLAGGIALAAFAVAASVGARVERKLVVQPVDGMRVFAQDASTAAETAPSNGATQKLRASPDAYAATYSYNTFGGDRLTVQFHIARASYDKLADSYGYYKRDIAAIDAWQNNARQGAYKYAVANHKSQDQLNAALESIKSQYVQKIRDYIQSRGFRERGENVVSVDVPGIIKRYTPVLNGVAGALDSVAQQQGYDSQGIVGAAASLVQTAVIYRMEPDTLPDGRHMAGFHPPAMTMIKGWGDCDTKTALLASILSNWPQMKMVGVEVPHHYLMGIVKIPEKGDAFVEYEGIQYVLIEPAGPAWLPPGHVADSTVALLEGSEGYHIDPFL